MMTRGKGDEDEGEGRRGREGEMATREGGDTERRDGGLGPGDPCLLGVFLSFSSLACNPPHAYECLLIGWFDNGS